MEQAASITAPGGFYEKVIFRMLSRMERGSLSVTLPGGQTLQLGNSDEVRASITIHNPRFFRHCLLYGDVGFGECYVNGDWDTDDITNVIKWFILNIDQAPSVSGSGARYFVLNALKLANRLTHARRANSPGGSKKNIAEHYDLSNRFFSLFLDPTMTYSSAYFTRQDMSLEEAQLAKYDRLCRQLHLKPSDHVLEIGSGWGGNAIYMAKQYGCRVTTLTISQEQFDLAQERIEKEGLGHKVNVLLKDYRHMDGRFDKIVSIEMLEAVGAAYYDTYFEKCAGLLKRNGILALQVITCPDPRFENLKSGVDWIQKHIFPGSLLPSVGAINNAVNKATDLTLVDLKDIGLHYAHTLHTWHRAFNRQLDEVVNMGFDNTFIRKWNYYLCYCEAAFAMRNINVMQMIYTRPNNTGR